MPPKATCSRWIADICGTAEAIGSAGLSEALAVGTATTAAGARTPKLVATCELGPDAVMLAYEHVGGRDLNTLPDDEITDELMESAWRQVQALQSRRIAHRRLDGGSLLVDRDGQVYLTQVRGGEIAEPVSEITIASNLTEMFATLEAGSDLVLRRGMDAPTILVPEMTVGAA